MYQFIYKDDNDNYITGTLYNQTKSYRTLLYVPLFNFPFSSLRYVILI